LEFDDPVCTQIRKCGAGGCFQCVSYVPFRHGEAFWEALELGPRGHGERFEHVTRPLNIFDEVEAEGTLPLQCSLHRHHGGYEFVAT